MTDFLISFFDTSRQEKGAAYARQNELQTIVTANSEDEAGEIFKAVFMSCEIKSIEQPSALFLLYLQSLRKFLSRRKAQLNSCTNGDGQ